MALARLWRGAVRLCRPAGAAADMRRGAAEESWPSRIAAGMGAAHVICERGYAAAAGDRDGAAPPPPVAADAFPDEFRFEILHRSARSAARVGLIHTPHGVVDTPGFVAVATNAALKAVPTALADAEGAQLVFANSYHLELHPGAAAVEAAGGLHEFMGRRRDRPLITDSGGFQIFSLEHGGVHAELHSLKRAAAGAPRSRRAGSLVRSVTEAGVIFRSYRDGAEMLLTPESAVDRQRKLGADIMMPLDHLPPYHVAPAALAESVARSHRWEARSLAAHRAAPRASATGLAQAMYGIVHGGSDEALRAASVGFVAAHDFDGVALGGALGADRAELLRIVAHALSCLPPGSAAAARPVHILGVADPASAPLLAALGADTMDSAYATRAGRHGALLTDSGPLRAGAGAHRAAHRPPVDGCACFTCRHHSLAYLHHLVKAREPLAATLLTLHNIRYMVDLFARMRARILRDEL
jgi:queuine tRNA-ribosyltransferase